MQVLADGRVRRTEAEWCGVVERFERSGLSMATFCRREKLPRSSFVKWRRALAGSGTPSPAFVEWVAPRAKEPEPGGGTSAGSFELALPGGAVLRWRV